MDRDHATKKLVELEEKYKPEWLNLNPPMAWIPYHLDRIERECQDKMGKGWDTFYALDYVHKLATGLEEKYSAKR